MARSKGGSGGRSATGYWRYKDVTMSGYSKDNTGILSRNERRETDRQPEFKGECTIDGRAFWISAWVNQRHDDAGKYFKLSFTEKKATAAGAGAGRDVDDDLGDQAPF